MQSDGGGSKKVKKWMVCCGRNSSSTFRDAASLSRTPRSEWPAPAAARVQLRSRASRCVSGSHAAAGQSRLLALTPAGGQRLTS